MEYVPMNIKQEIVSANTDTTININGSSASTSSNNNSSQATPDSVENKVSIHTHTGCRKLSKSQKLLVFNACSLSYHFLPFMIVINGF